MGGGLFGSMGACSEAGRETAVYLVRHAEKDPDGSDPGLSPEGQRRARVLAEKLGGSDVRAIYVTPYQRTRQTAASVAERAGVTPTVVDTGGDVRAHAKRIADQIRERDAGSTVLVVGHSNTVPAVIEALGYPHAPAIRESEFDHLFLVTIRPTGEVSLARARYGN